MAENRLQHIQHLLSVEEILSGYKEVSKLYPFVPSLSLWRAWECAFYKRYSLVEPVLDVGCGDGRFFQLVWPDIQDVTGVDIDPGVVKMAQETGIYRKLYVGPAHDIPIKASSFASAFANCSLEHMDNLEQVLQSIASSLSLGSMLLLSVTTQKFLEWLTLPLIIKSVGAPQRAEELSDEYIAYHHLINALTPQEWMNRLEDAGFEVISYAPLLPEFTGRIFLFIDQLWHIKSETDEIGMHLEKYFSSLPNFNELLGDMISIALRAEKEWQTGCGAVFCAIKI